MILNTIFQQSFKTFLKRSCSLIFLSGLFFDIFAQLPTAQEIAAQMKVGWNLGNTLEAICSETAWGNPKTTQKLIDSVKAAGYDAIRLPCAWDCHTTDGIINEGWIARVKEIVDH